MKFWQFNIYKPLKNSQNYRNIEIDTLRGIACILLVAYHVIGNNEDAGLKISTGFIRDINDSLALIRMPLFTFLSGYIYAYRPFKIGVAKFLFAKTRRLLVPMVVVGLLFAFIQINIPTTNNNVTTWYLLLIKPYAHFWFAEALFIIYLVVIPLEKLNFLRHKVNTILIFLIAMIIYISPLYIPWFSISGAIYLFPYFIFGMFVFRFDIIKSWRQYWGWILILTIILVTPFIPKELIASKKMWLPLLIGLSGCLGLLLTKIKIGWLAIVGKYSYAIYLHHIFFTAGMRILLQNTGVHDITILFGNGLIFGILGPIVIYFFCSKNNLCRLFFLGEKAIKR